MRGTNDLVRFAVVTIGLILFAETAGAHFRQQMPPPRPKPAPTPQPRLAPARPADPGAVLLLTADDACELFVDGEKVADLKRDEVRKVPVSLGQHLVRAVNPTAEWRSIIEIKEKRQYVLVTELKSSKSAPADPPVPSRASPPPSAPPPAAKPAPSTRPAPEMSAEDTAALNSYWRSFAAAVTAITREYPDPVEADAAVYAGIRGLLDTIDPYSQFFTPQEYAALRQQDSGSRFGTGISIVKRDGAVSIAEVAVGSPSEAAGLTAGEVLLDVDGQAVDSKSVEDVAKLLSGTLGSRVKVTVQRRGQSARAVELTRADIRAASSVTVSGMLENSVGYIWLSRFQDSADQDLAQALRQLTGVGMQRLVLDLRGNVGGPLDQALKVAARFLPAGTLVVSTRGRAANSNQEYRTEPANLRFEGPLAVIIDRRSASAAEIVAGSVQDNRRGVIVGEPSFGKALVQSVYRLSGNAGLAMTTAHYYTPGGKRIVRTNDSEADATTATGGIVPTVQVSSDAAGLRNATASRLNFARSDATVRAAVKAVLSQ